MVDNSERLDRLFAALSDATRRAMLARLARGESTVTALAEPFAMSLPAVAKHVHVLEAAGLVARTVDGRRHRLRLVAGPLGAARGWIERQQHARGGKAR